MAPTAAYLIAFALTLLILVVLVGGFVMSAEIIQFVPRPRRDRSPLTVSSRRPVRHCGSDDLAMAHADTAPCEYAPPPEISCDDDTPA